MAAPLFALMLAASVAGAEEPPAVFIGQPAVQFRLAAVNEDTARELLGRTQVGLADFVGVSPLVPSRAVVVHFFDRANGGDDLGTLNRIQRRYDTKGVQVVAISTDGGELGSLSTWVESQKLDFPVVRDNYEVVRDRYGVAALPMTYVIDENATVFSVGRATGDALEEELSLQLVPLLGR